MYTRTIKTYVRIYPYVVHVKAFITHKICNRLLNYGSYCRYKSKNI